MQAADRLFLDIYQSLTVSCRGIHPVIGCDIF
ncbi:MAG: hypothetical protein RL018_161, partial [Pseudomonadota bacterium]